MRNFSMFLAAAAVLISSKARAQTPPPGPYTTTCHNVQVTGSSLAADCRGPSGSFVHTVLPDYARCGSSIANSFGILTCPAQCSSVGDACFAACYGIPSCHAPSVDHPVSATCASCLSKCTADEQAALQLPSSLQLAVPVQDQQQGQWCWAATTQMIASYFGQTFSQCQIVDTAFNLSNCCDAAPGSLHPILSSNNECSGCDCGNAPPLATYGLTSTTTWTPPSWTTITHTFACDNTPIAFAWHWCFDGQPYGGHVMVATGYDVVNGEDYVWINNPEEPEPKEVPYSDWASTSCADGAGNDWDGDNINIQ